MMKGNWVMRRLRHNSGQPKQEQTGLDHSVTQLRVAGIVLGAIVGNLLISKVIQPIAFNVTLGIFAVYTWAAGLLPVSNQGFFKKTATSYALDILLVSSLCYFSGAVASPFHLYYLPIIVLAARHGLSRASILAVTASLLFVLTSLLQWSASADLTLFGLYLLILLLLPFVVSLIVGPRIHNIARFNAENVIKSQGEINRLESLNALSKSLIGPLGYDEWLDEAIQRVADIFNTDVCWLYDYEESRPIAEQLQLLVAIGVDDKSKAKYRSLSVGVGVTGHAAQSSQVDVLDGPGDSRTVLIREFAFGSPHEFGPYRIALPLIAHGRCVGVLTLVNNSDPKRPAEDLELIRTVANQMAIAIDNARLYGRERQRRAHTLAISEITKAAHFGLGLEEVLQRIRQELKKILEADLCQVWIANAEETHFQLRVPEGEQDEQQVVAIADIPLLESAISEGAPMYELRATADKQFARKLDMMSLIALPLLGRGRILGIIVLGYNHEVRLLPEERPLMQTLADQVAASVDNVQLYEDLRGELHSRSVLYRFMRNLSISSQHQEACECFFAEIRQLFPVQYTIILALNEELSVLEKLACDGLTKAQSESLVSCMVPMRDCWAIKRGDRFMMAKNEQGLRCHHVPVDSTQTERYVCIPLMAGGQVLGVVQAGFTQDLSRSQLGFLDTLSEQLAETLHRIGLYEQIQNLADRDPLTDVYNYGYFQRHLKFEIARSKRNRTMLSLIYVDIDHFKNFNDTFGHPVGDQLLRKFTKVLQNGIREVDLLARLGGEEFAVLLPDTNKRGAVILAEKLRELIEKTEFMGNTQQPVVHKTVSLGIATYPEDATDGDELVRKADDALYQAKEGGRNQVITA